MTRPVFYRTDSLFLLSKNRFAVEITAGLCGPIRWKGNLVSVAYGERRFVFTGPIDLMYSQIAPCIGIIAQIGDEQAGRVCLRKFFPIRVAQRRKGERVEQGTRRHVDTVQGRSSTTVVMRPDGAAVGRSAGQSGTFIDNARQAGKPFDLIPGTYPGHAQSPDFGRTRTKSDFYAKKYVKQPMKHKSVLEVYTTK